MQDNYREADARRTPERMTHTCMSSISESGSRRQWTLATNLLSLVEFPTTLSFYQSRELNLNDKESWRKNSRKLNFPIF